MFTKSQVAKIAASLNQAKRRCVLNKSEAQGVDLAILYLSFALSKDNPEKFASERFLWDAGFYEDGPTSPALESR